MISPLSPEGVVELAVLERSGMIESRHLGAACVVDGSGAVIRSLGDIDALVYGRSTLKFVQAVALLECGVDLDGEQLVLAAASHTGTARHVAVVESILARAGLDADALQCPIDWPADPAARRASVDRSRLTMNCSGKHAAFLLACVTNGWSTTDYLDPAHPLQAHIRATLERLTGEPIAQVGVDGCGAPVFAVSLRGLATAVSRVSSAAEGPAARLSRAIRSHAWALDSPAVESVIDGLGLIAKNGAEGVFVAGTPDGTAVALKMLDGSMRASITVGLALLASVNAVDTPAAHRIAQSVTEPVLGGGIVVGAIRATV